MKNIEEINRKTGYSQAVAFGDLVFVAGQIPVDQDGNTVGANDIRKQAEQVFANLKSALAAAGSSETKILKTTVFTTKAEYRPIINAVRDEVFSANTVLPASTFVVVSALAAPDWDVEVEAVAVR